MRLTSANNRLLIPDRGYVKMKYADMVSVDSTYQSGNHWQLYYAANEITQPGLAVTTGRSNLLACNGVNEWDNFYGKYRVNACKITCKFIKTITSSTYSDQLFQQISVVPASEDTLTTMLADSEVQSQTDKYSRYSLLGSANSSAGVKTLKNFMSTKKIFGWKYPSIDGGESVVGDMISGTFPTQLWYWVIKLAPLDGALAAGQTADCYIQVNITYYVEMFDRRDTDMNQF